MKKLAYCYRYCCSDASLRYLYTGLKTGNKGRSKEVDGKENLGNLRMDYFEEVACEESDGKVATRNVRVVIVDCMVPGHHIYHILGCS